MKEEIHEMNGVETSETNGQGLSNLDWTAMLAMAPRGVSHSNFAYSA